MMLARALEAGWDGSMFIEFPTGYGKTTAAVIAAHILRLRGQVTHILILVPSDEQRGKWIKDGPEAFKEVSGTALDIIDAGDHSALRYFSVEGVKAFTTTIQTATGKVGSALLDQMLSRGRWLVVVDEAQYYAPEAEGASWSSGLKAILDKPSVERWLGMSATPLRRSRRYGLLGEPDLVVPLKVALDEEAIRKLAVRAEEYVVDVQMDDEGTPVRVHTSEVAKWAGPGAGKPDGSAITAWELRHRVRYHHKFLSQIIAHALKIFLDKLTHHPRQHQMLVFAMSVRHAKHLTEAINKVAPEMGFADYIGDTDDPQAHRKPEHNKAVLDRFKANQLPCLVQVAKAGVGFDNKRCSTLLFLNVIGNSPLLLQFIGRGLRRNAEVPQEEDVCHAIVSMDHPGLELFREMDTGDVGDEDIGLDIPGPGGGGDGDCGNIRLTNLPEFFLIDATFDHAEIIEPFVVEERLRRLRESANPEVRELIAHAEARAGGDIFAYVQKAIILERSEELTELRLAARHEQAKAQVNNARNTIATNVLALRNGTRKTIDSSQYGPIYRALDGHYIRMTGLPQKTMTVADLQAKYDWLKGVNDLVRQSKVPDFLDL